MQINAPPNRLIEYFNRSLNIETLLFLHIICLDTTSLKLLYVKTATIVENIKPSNINAPIRYQFEVDISIPLGSVFS